MSIKFESDKIQKVPKLLDHYLLKLGEIKFQVGELDKHINRHGITLVQMAIYFTQFNELLMEIREMCLDDGKYKIKK
jgi:hypothetical protein